MRTSVLLLIACLSASLALRQTYLGDEQVFAQDEQFADEEIGQFIEDEDYSDESLVETENVPKCLINGAVNSAVGVKIVYKVLALKTNSFVYISDQSALKSFLATQPSKQ